MHAQGEKRLPLNSAFVAAVLFSFLTPPAQAHPGHDLGDANVAHLLTSSGHLAVFGLSGAALWLAAWFTRRRVEGRVLQGLGLVAFAVALWFLQV